MKRIVWIICASILLLNSCREDINTTNITVIKPEPEVNVVSKMKGVIMDEDSNPISSAMVSVRAETTFTNDKGEYSFDNIIANQGKEQITVTKSGYFTQATKIYNQSETESYSEIKLIARDIGTTVSSSMETNFPIQGEASLRFPANSLRKLDGTLYEGEALV